MLIKRFIGGKTINHAKKLQLPFGKIYDYVKESDPKSHLENHKKNIYGLESTINSIHAIKLTGLYNSNLENYLDDYNKVGLKQNHKILIDAENVESQEMINKYTDYCIKNYNIFYKTYQMYRKDQLKLLEIDLEKYKERNFGIKLVRGAYYNEDKVTGLLHKNKDDTDKDYNNAIELLSNYNNDVIIATHNRESCNLALKYNRDFKYAQLLGMNDELSKYLLDKNNDVYKYIPYGSWYESIPYLVRRLYENYDIIKYVV
ncbi:MAG: proline dehydrogenase family protein [Magnetovibrio sp.]|nr:proline dehydrogenase family protein [Magnetovibrio sp.]